MDVHANAIVVEGEDVTSKKDRGVLKKIIKEGEGEDTPAIGCEVKAHYVGRLLNGEQFDSSRDGGQPFTFTLGQGQVIKGWDEGVVTMKKGEIAQLICAPSYAYGKKGSPPKIPGNSTLAFEIELISWSEIDLSHGENGVLKRILAKGEGYISIKEEATVKAHIRGSYKEQVFEERDVTYIVGVNEEEVGVVPGLAMGIRSMMNHEKARFQIKPSYAFGSDGSSTLGVPPDSEVVYEVYLCSFENPKDFYAMSLAEKLSKAESLKENGTSFVKAGNYQRALADYEKIIRVLESVYKDDEVKQVHQRRYTAHLNAALCCLKMGDFNKVVKECDAALAVECKSVKAFFRKGQALFNQQKYELAQVAFEKALELEPTNTAAAEQIQLCKLRIQEQEQKSKALYTRMFSAVVSPTGASEQISNKACTSDDDINSTPSKVESESNSNPPVSPMEVEHPSEVSA